MNIAFDAAWVAAVLFCALRLGAVLALTPVLTGIALPPRMTVLLILSLSAILVMGGVVQPAPLPHDLLALLLSGLAELATGALLAFAIFVAFAAFSLAGKLLDIQIGFSVGSIFDPITRTRSPVLASTLDLFAIAAFFALNAHHMLLRGLAYSLERVPLGRMVELASPELLARQFGLVFIHGLLLAAPVAFCLLLVDVGLAVLSRNIPQLNVFILSIPIKIVIGLSMLALMAQMAGPLLRRMFDAIFQFWSQVLG
ncbi:flagellar biosynthetic protein FliR [Chitinimonas lacunae]|uniref:Flagellar biosynthetic protein FliR n=1 Tax=Chitinimonas lacunae TaxID=1963018 RepID=A0ABV8MYJ6_9NEIS